MFFRRNLGKTTYYRNLFVFLQMQPVWIAKLEFYDERNGSSDYSHRLLHCLLDDLQF